MKPWIGDSFRIYPGRAMAGWRLFGIGYRNTWFLGLSVRDDESDGRPVTVTKWGFA